MLRLLADENFNGHITRGVLRRKPDLDLIRVQDTVLAGADDPDILNWAAENDRIVLTHDAATMRKFANDRLRAGQRLAGVFLINDRFPVGKAIDELLLMTECSEQAEWDGQVVRLQL